MQVKEQLEDTLDGNGNEDLTRRGSHDHDLINIMTVNVEPEIPVRVRQKTSQF